jgi:hypothetical protein
MNPPASWQGCDCSSNSRFVLTRLTPLRADKRPQCVVTLSAPVDFSDRTPADGVLEIDPTFILGTENYVNSADLATLQARSPISLVAAPTQEAPFVPLFMANSWYDNLVPYHQMVDMICKLQSVGVPDDAYKTLRFPIAKRTHLPSGTIGMVYRNPPLLPLLDRTR